MELKYDNIMYFIKNYFKAYSTIAQDPKTSHQMHEYYAPDIKVAQYFPQMAISDRDQFLRISSSHPTIQETLIPEHIIVDDRQKMVAVLLRGEFTIKATGEVITQIFTAHYQLKLDEKNTIKIKNLWIFAEYVPPGKQNIVDLYEEAFRKLE